MKVIHIICLFLIGLALLIGGEIWIALATNSAWWAIVSLICVFAGGAFTGLGFFVWLCISSTQDETVQDLTGLADTDKVKNIRTEGE